MDGVTAQALLQTFGGPGLFIAYLIWRGQVDRVDRKEKETLDREVIKEDLASRNALAGTLAAMTEAIRNAGSRLPPSQGAG